MFKELKAFLSPLKYCWKSLLLIFVVWLLLYSLVSYNYHKAVRLQRESMSTSQYPYFLGYTTSCAKIDTLKQVQKSIRDTQKIRQPVSRGSTKSVMSNFEVSWYNNEGISYTTTSGRKTVDGVTVSVDPRIIPLGTWIEIIMPDGTVLKRRADDTGKAVKGRILDVYANQPTSVLLERGRTKNVKVRIL